MDWQVTGEKCEMRIFDNFEILDILIEYDGPRLFTTETALGRALFMLVDEDADQLRYIVVPTNTKAVDSLKTGLITVRDALEQPLLWVVDTRLDNTVVESWRSSLSSLPEDILPEKGAMLWPHLQPAFSLRAIGEGLGEGTVPASVIRQVIDGASTALRKAALHIFDEPSRQGRMSNALKRLYDLPAQNFSYNSFEIAFRLPEAIQVPLSLTDNAGDDEIFLVGKELESAVVTLLQKESGSLDDLDINLLEALEKLVPPLSGAVREFEVGGTILNATGKRYRLNREVARTVKKTLQVVRGKEERIATLGGVVSEMDRDNLTFTLRQTSDGKDHICSFGPDIFDEVLSAFNEDVPVTVSGRETIKNGNIEVSIFNIDESSVTHDR